MASREADAYDRAAMLYIKRRSEEVGLTRGELARQADLPYPTLVGYWKDDARAVPFGVIKRLLRALPDDTDQAMDAIDRIAGTLESPPEQ